MKRFISHPKGMVFLIFLLSLAFFSGCAEETEVETLPADVFNALFGHPANTNFESGPNGWNMTGLWHISNRRSVSGPNSAWYGDEATGNFDVPPGVANSGNLVRNVNLTDVTRMEFDYFLDNECIEMIGTNPCGIDTLRPQVSTNGGVTWIDLDLINGAQGLPETQPPGIFLHPVLDLTPFNGTTVAIRFNFDTLDFISNNFEGAFVDNIQFFQ